MDFVEIGEVVRRSKWLETGLERSEHDAHAGVGDDARGHTRGLDEVSRVVVGAPRKIHDLAWVSLALDSSQRRLRPMLARSELL